MNNNPVGIFDSGLGGLSVWKEVKNLLPHESLLYLGDGLNCPYGRKDPEFIREISDRIVLRLLDQGAKLIVVACNTATAAAISFLREKYPAIPFVGMEPALKPAVFSTATGVVGVLATEGSLEGDLYRNTSEKYGQDVKILESEGNNFVEIVESNAENSAESCGIIARVIEPMIDAGADRLVLGCTHYPFLTNAIRNIIGDREVEIIDPAPAVARQVEKLLSEKGIRSDADNFPRYNFYTLSDNEYLDRIKDRAARISGMDFL